MSKNINVNPGQYKTAGRERQGENIVHEIEKRKARSLAREEKRPPAGKAASPNRGRASAAAGRPAQPAGISNRMGAAKEAKDRSMPPSRRVAGASKRRSRQP
jgi:hypothetical protein